MLDQSIGWSLFHACSATHACFASAKELKSAIITDLLCSSKCWWSWWEVWPTYEVGQLHMHRILYTTLDLCKSGIGSFGFNNRYLRVCILTPLQVRVCFRPLQTLMTSNCCRNQKTQFLTCNGPMWYTEFCACAVVLPHIMFSSSSSVFGWAQKSCEDGWF